jgi:hypothetical protein
MHAAEAKCEILCEGEQAKERQNSAARLVITIQIEATFRR